MIQLLGDQEKHALNPRVGATLPADIARRLRLALERASAGESDPLLTPLRLPGGKGNLSSVGKSFAIRAAIAYLTAADEGIVQDSRSRTTVSESYGVTVQQVRRWCKSIGSDARRRKDLGDLLSETWPNVQSKDKPRLLRKLMKAYSGEYREARERQKY